MTYQKDQLSLVADVGGTNTRVALARGAEVLPDTVSRFANNDYDSLQSVLSKYVDDHERVDCRAACIAMAGPVKDGVAHLTNRGWQIDKDTLAQITRAETTAILNDLQAQGHAIGHLPAAGTREVIAAPTPCADQSTYLVIGIGTGFNIAPVHIQPPHRLVAASEAGHALLPLRSSHDLRLADFLAQDHGVAAVEDILSGRGLAAAYAFHAREAGRPAKSGSREVLAAFHKGSDPLARAAAQSFVRFLGLVASNMALIHLPFGGIYLAGGMARAFAGHLTDLGFKDAFRDKGRFTTFMDQFPLHVIEDDYAALTGCAAHLEALAPA